ncbi:hypothetical protein B9Z19DRAFT_1137189 [Tuber borchii]|uniref:Uncharacterized protein n=1 Tax=Tuber borchii TaxID=42251 RepID=A0A2T6ZAW6_TUBBO|nr:hypothetical protein B9Z19DRAFT_1137189 [Tuber borchii]
MDIHHEEPERPTARVIFRGPFRGPHHIIGASGAAWIKPGSSQPPDPSFDTVRHQKITHALLAELGREDLIPTPAPDDDIIDPKELWEHEKIQSLKRIERNRILYPKRLSPVDETLFMTPRKRAINPTYFRTRVTIMYLTLGDETMDSTNDPEVATTEGSGKLRLLRVGGDRPRKPQHRLDLWKRDLPSDQN